jgi:hypothetical protein
MAEATDELEQLKQRKERLELKAQIGALTAPWWRKASLIATVTALAAAIVPVKTAIEEHYASEREYVLQRGKQEHEIRMAYLDRFQVPGHRLQTLRFLIATSTDERLLKWAKGELLIVQAEVNAIVEELRMLADKIEKAPPGQELAELKQLYQELKKLYAVTTFSPTQRPGATAE